MPRNYDSQPSNGRRIVIGAISAIALVAAFKYMPAGLRERVTTLRDECGQWDLFYQPSNTSVVSCSPYLDRTTQEAKRESFTFVPIPHSSVKLDNGSYGVSVHLDFAQGTPFRLFGKNDNFTLTELGQELERTEDLRAFCVADLKRVVGFVQQHATDFESTDVNSFDIGTAENAYNVFPAGREPNDMAVPELTIIDADSGKPADESLVACWTA